MPGCGITQTPESPPETPGWAKPLLEELEPLKVYLEASKKLAATYQEIENMVADSEDMLKAAALDHHPEFEWQTFSPQTMKLIEETKKLAESMRNVAHQHIKHLEEEKRSLEWDLAHGPLPPGD